MKNTQEIRAMNDKQLQEELLALYKQQFNLRIQNRAGQAIKPHLFKQIRRSIARFKTIISQKARETNK